MVCWKDHRCCHLTDLVTGWSPLQQQPETIGRLLVVFQALTQPTIIILHQSSVHNHFELAWRESGPETTASDQRQQLELTYWTFRLESIDANTLSYLSFRNITNDDKRISSAHKRADLNCFTLWEPLKGEEGELSAWVLMHSKQRKIPHVSKITSIKRLNEEKWHIIE